jgi:hypothetical protein
LSEPPLSEELVEDELLDEELLEAELVELLELEDELPPSPDFGFEEL